MTEPEHDATDSESSAIRSLEDLTDDPSRTLPSPEIDLDAIERDLSGVEVALTRLADGTYWTDEVTDSPIPDHILAADPTARRA